MKLISLLLFAMICSTTLFGQSYTAFIKKGLSQISVYDSSKKNIIGAFDNETYFDCEVSMGEWYNITLPYFREGYVHKESLQFFELSTFSEQKQRLYATFTKFLAICNENGNNITKLNTGITNTSYSSSWQPFYEKAFYPMLNMVFLYYPKTRDSAVISTLLKLSDCKPDGEFARTYYSLIGFCYTEDRLLFIRQMRKIKDPHAAIFSADVLMTGISFYYHEIEYNKISHKKKDNLDVESVIAEEQRRAKIMLQ